jgi:hypothetical protein
MTTATHEPNPGRAASLLPPEERFWKRYSPHGEAPLSMAGSVTLHGLIVGLFLLFAVYLATLFLPSTRTLPVEPVRLAPGGNGPGAAGFGGQPGNAAGEPGHEAGKDDETIPGQDDALPPRPRLSKIERQQIDENFDPDLARKIAASDSGPALARLEDAVRRKLMQGLAAPPAGGGKKGPGAGDGPGTGQKGKIARDPRIERMLRWQMRFQANSGAEYLAQLRSLGAILAIPISDGPEPKYKVVRDLQAPAKLLDEDLAKINRIYWIDDRPSSVRDLLAALGLSLKPAPQRFVAFMPQKLEESLYDMERRYASNVLGLRPFDESRINETHFKVVRTARGYRPELDHVTLKR